jgi:uncharacterized protein YdhG (YjbR/CyaY superfamily)
MPMPKFATVDDYLAGVPEPGRSQLAALRRIVREAAPDALESLSYGIIAYNLRGRLVYIGPAKKHVGLYAVGDSLMQRYAAELAPYRSKDTTIRFPLDASLPAELIATLVRARVAENERRSNG